MKKYITGLTIFAIILFISSLIIASDYKNSKRVFIVASYEDDHVCGWPQEAGTIKGLNKQGWFEGMNLVLETYYMDSKRTHTTPEAMKAQAEIALDKIEKFNPDIVVTIDDNAFREVGLRLIGRDDVSVVFSGMNGQPESYNKKAPFMETREKPGANCTGVYEKLYVVRSIKVMKNAIANSENGVFVGITDFTPTGNAITRQFEIELAGKPENEKWRLERVRDWNKYTALISELNKDKNVLAIYPVALSLKVSEDVTYTAPEIFKWTMDNCGKPDMALNYFFSKIGLFGGAAVDFQAMGFLAGKKAGLILNGNKAGNLPIEDAPEYAIVFNLARAKQLGIQIPEPLLTAADFVYQ
jgi:ABC-type uncharacterized transport system substrate-binding protein